MAVWYCCRRNRRSLVSPMSRSRSRFSRSPAVGRGAALCVTAACSSAWFPWTMYLAVDWFSGDRLSWSGKPIPEINIRAQPRATDRMRPAGRLARMPTAHPIRNGRGIRFNGLRLLFLIRSFFSLSELVPASAPFGGSRWNNRVTAVVIRSCSSLSGTSLSSRTRELAIF